MLAILLSALFFGSMATYVFAAAFGNSEGTAGASFNIADNEPAKYPTVSFEPSTKVKMTGATDDYHFAVASWHEGVEGEDEGKAFGMSHAGSKMQWYSFRNDATAPAAFGSDDTGPSAFGAGWATL